MLPLNKLTISLFTLWLQIFFTYYLQPPLPLAQFLFTKIIIPFFLMTQVKCRRARAMNRRRHDVVDRRVVSVRLSHHEWGLSSSEGGLKAYPTKTPGAVPPAYPEVRGGIRACRVNLVTASHPWTAPGAAPT